MQILIILYLPIMCANGQNVRVLKEIGVDERYGNVRF